MVIIICQTKMPEWKITSDEKSGSTKFFSIKSCPVLYIKVFAVLGARHVQTRLVEPKTSSMNSGDVFVLVTPKYVHQWNGKNCSIMEKSRVSCPSRHVLVYGRQCKYQNKLIKTPEQLLHWSSVSMVAWNN